MAEDETSRYKTRDQRNAPLMSLASRKLTIPSLMILLENYANVVYTMASKRKCSNKYNAFPGRMLF